MRTEVFIFRPSGARTLPGTHLGEPDGQTVAVPPELLTFYHVLLDTSLKLCLQFVELTTHFGYLYSLYNLIKKTRYLGSKKLVNCFMHNKAIKLFWQITSTGEVDKPSGAQKPKQLTGNSLFFQAVQCVGVF